MSEQQFKRHVAYKLRIGDLLNGKVIMDGERFRFLEIGDKNAVRVNVIANIVDKFVQDGEKKFASITLDDASGQIKVKTFGEEITTFEPFSQGDTIQLIGVLRQWNNEVYLMPEIMKKREPRYLLVRKLEIDAQAPKQVDAAERVALKDKIIDVVKKEEENGGADVEKLILDLKSSPEVINQEIKRLLEEGIVYEPRPGKIRYLG